MKFSLFKKSPKAGHEVHPDFESNTGDSYLTVLDMLEDRLKPELYLEIGSRSGTSLQNRSCDFIAIDPEFRLVTKATLSATRMYFFQQTSDDFFAGDFLSKMETKPGLAFIDGMHLFEFALRDFINCESNMTSGGVICFHDVAPFNHAMTTRDVDYLATGRPWTGDVWKAMLILKDYRPDLRINILRAGKTGLGVVQGLDPSNSTLSEKYDEILSRYTDLTLQEYGTARFFSECNTIPVGDFVISKEQAAPFTTVQS